MAKLKDGFYKQTAEAIGSDLHVLLAGGGSKALSDFATSTGVVTALGTNGDYVTWTKNGTANNLTVPYATKSGSLVGIYSSTLPSSTFDTGAVKYYYNILLNTEGLFPHHNNANSILTVSKHQGNYLSQLGFSSDKRLYFRSANGDDINSLAWNTIAYVSEIPTKVSQLTNDSGYLTKLPSHTHTGLTFATTTTEDIENTTLDTFNIFRTSSSTTGGTDGWIMDYTWANSKYRTQIYIDVDSTYNVSVRHRTAEGTWKSWKKLAYTSDIPTVTNYYWANVKISDQSSTSTSPTFANATTTGLLTVSTGGSHCGIKVGNNYINAINGELIIQNNTAIRFGDDSWDYDVWAGLRYVSSAKTIHLGLADKSIFSGNNVLGGGTLNLPGIHHISSALYNIKVGSVAQHTPSTSGWYTVAQVSGYFNYDIYITGGWHNGMPSTVRVNICNINGTSKITQLAGYVGGICSQIRLGKVSTDVWDVQVYIPTQPGTMGEQRCIFTGFGGLTVHHTSTLASTSYSATNTLVFGQISGISLTTDNYTSYLDGRYYTETEADDRFVNVTGDNMTGSLTFSTDSSITWSRNTDYASIRFKNTGDGDADSYLDLQTGDNGNEYIRFSRVSGSTTSEVASFKSDGARINGNIWTSATGTVTANYLDLRGATNATMTYASTNPCIVFSEQGGQCVKLLYTDYDSYRSPAGLKVIGNQGGEWFEVDGQIYASGGYPVITSVADGNGYPALLTPSGTNNWIRVSNSSSYGLLPNQSGGAGSGHGYLGTSSWYFKYAYIDQIYGYLNGNISGNASTVTVNDSNANSTYRMVWHSGNTLYGTGGIYCNPYTDSLYATHFYETSDINLKKNIKAILDSDNIPVIKEFDWKSDGTHSYGLIAQELEEQGYSELVSNSGSHKTVNYSAALSLIVGKLQNKIKELEAEIENLKLRA